MFRGERDSFWGKMGNLWGEMFDLPDENRVLLLGERRKESPVFMGVKTSLMALPLAIHWGLWYDITWNLS